MGTEGQKDRGDKNHKFELLFRRGIPGSILGIREYLFDDATIIDALTLYGCGTIGTKTITPLPSTTIEMYIHVGLYANSFGPNITFKRNSGDINSFLIFNGSATAPQGYLYELLWIPTEGNQFFIQQIIGTVQSFKILGYKEKID